MQDITSYEIAGMIGSLEASPHKIVKKNLGLTRKVSRWIPHMLTNDPKAARVKMAKTIEIVPFWVEMFL